jgi:hypothetical protein
VKLAGSEGDEHVMLRVGERQWSVNSPYPGHASMRMVVRYADGRAARVPRSWLGGEGTKHLTMALL